MLSHEQSEAGIGETSVQDCPSWQFDDGVRNGCKSREASIVPALLCVSHASHFALLRIFNTRSGKGRIY
jgi:hypothetical protein